MDKNIKFTREETRDKGLPFLDCAAFLDKDGNFSIKVYRKSTNRPVPPV